MGKLSFYKVYRYGFHPSIVFVFAKNKKDAQEIVGKKYGGGWSSVDSIRVKRGLTIDEGVPR